MLETDTDPKLIPSLVRAALDLYVQKGYPTGSFLRSVLSNDLNQALTRADLDSLRGLRALVSYLRNSCPADCWGSPAAVDAWRAHRGLEGIRDRGEA